MDGTHFDLRPYSMLFPEWLHKEIKHFAAENQNTEISAMGLQYVFAGNKPHVSIAFDTKESSDSFVQSNVELGRDWYSKDEFGSFGDNPADYYFEPGEEFVFDDFPDITEINPCIINIRTGADTYERADISASGDAALNNILFPFIVNITKGFRGHEVLKLDKHFRVCVRAYNSPLLEHWLAAG